MYDLLIGSLNKFCRDDTLCKPSFTLSKTFFKTSISLMMTLKV